MAVTDDFTTSELDLNGVLSITSPTALVWGPDGRLFVTQQTGEIFVLDVAFGDKNPNDGDNTVGFYVTDAETVTDVKAIPNHNDNGSDSSSSSRQVTGIDVTQQFDSNGNPVTIDGKPAVVMYVTSSDNRIGAGEDGEDKGLDTNSGVITRLTQTQNGWDAVDIVRGLPRSEENHATNGLEVIQELNGSGQLISERMIVASGGNANTGAPSNNFAGQQETPLSGALLEIDLDEIRAIEANDGVKIDDGREYVYDIPTLNDPTRGNSAENADDPFGGNDGLNSGKLLDGGPVQIYSAGYRNAYDVEVTEDGRVFTYDNGANNVWGGRPAGEDQNGNNLAFDDAPGTPNGYIATNLFVEDNAELTGNFNPQNWDQLHEATRSDDLNGRDLSAGLGGATTYQWDHPDFAQPLTLVYGGHPNPTRAEGARAGLLYTPEGGVGNAKLMVSNVQKPGGSSDFLEVVQWLSDFGYSNAFINATVVAVDPGVLYADDFKAGFGGSGANGRPTSTGVFSLEEDTNGPIGIPSDIDDIVETLNPIEGDYLEAGYTDGALDTGKGSINGLTEYTSSIFDDAGQAAMQGALIAASLNQAQLLVIGRENDGTVDTATTTEGNSSQANNTPRTVAANKEFVQSGGAPLGVAALGDDLAELGNQVAFRGTIWAGIFKQNGPVIEIYQPGNATDNALLGAANYAGQSASDTTDNDLDGVDHLNDPFEFDSDNGITLGAGENIELTFAQTDLASQPEFSGTIGDTGLMGAALDGVTPNRDAKSAADGFPANQQEDGLFDNGGNLIPGGNAPIFQIKEVQDGSALNGSNTLRDAVHTGVKLENDVQRLVAETDIANWWQSQPGGGRVSGLSFGDGTQFNFVRVVFGDVNNNGQLGLEVGIETGDNYTVLGTVTDAAFTAALTTGDPTGGKRVVLQFEVSDIGGSYTMSASYKIRGETEFTEIALSNATLPAGVLRDVLDGTHTISDGDVTVGSGAAIGFMAEKNNGVVFESVDFDELRINAFGNEIYADTEAEAEVAGTSDLDTVIYSGPTADIDLHPTVENFDGSESGANWDVTGNANDNLITTGTGDNVITTGTGNDQVIGTKAGLDGDEITDFTLTDKVIITDGSSNDANNVTYANVNGAAVVNVNGTEITFSGPDFADFDPANGAATFNVGLGAEGLEITLGGDETILYRVNAGNSTIAAIDGGPDWQSDAAFENGSGPVFISGSDGSVNSSTLTDAENEVEFDNSTFAANSDVAPWELFVEERSKGGGDLVYNFEVETGKTYKITVYYAEGFNNIFNANPRIFDIGVEGAVPAAFDDIHPLREATDAVDGAGAALPTFANGTDPLKGPYLGRASEREHTYVATDNLLTLSFQKSAETGVQNPKVNAIQITEVNSGEPPADVTAPVVTNIVVEDSLSDQDSPRQVTVTVTDETDFDAADFAGLDGSELSFTGITPASVSAPVVTLSGDEKTATLVYTIDPPAATGAWPTGDFAVTMAAGALPDAAGNTAGTASFDFTFSDTPQPGDVILAVNAGGSAVDGTAYGLPGVTFEADTSANPHPTVDFSQTTTGGGNGNNTNNQGNGDPFTGLAIPDDVFTSERFGNDFSYDVDVPNGTYIVDLYFAETFVGVAPNADGVGERVFDVAIEDNIVLNDYDLFDDGDGVLGNGAGAPLVKTVKTVQATVTDGTLNIRLDTIQDGGEIAENNAKISAFVVRIPEGNVVTATLAGATSVEENDGSASYTITLNEAPTVTTVVTVNLTQTGAVAAGIPGDVELLLGGTEEVLTFEPGGSLTQTVTVILPDDTKPELAETYAISFSGVGVTAGGTNSITTTIAANDGPVDSVNGVAATKGDFADSGLSPTDLGTLAQGETIVVANQQGDSAPGGRERDYFTFTVAEGQVLSGLILEDWETDEIGLPQAFIGIQEGNQVTVNPATFENVGDLLGGHVYNAGDVENPATSQDGNLLSAEALGKGSETGPGGTFVFGDGSGFTAPLPAGTYTVWLNQGGDASRATLRIVTEEEVIPGAIRIQAEDFDSSTTFAPETIAAADEGEVVALPKNGFSGTATYDLAGVVDPGLYTVRVTYFDENDGESLLGLTITSDGEPAFSKGFRMDADTPAGNAQASTLRSTEFVNVEIGANGQLVLNGTTIGSEFARVDYFDFIPQEGPVSGENTAPFTQAPIPDQDATENSPFSLNVANLFVDNEDDDLTFEATSNLPGGALPAGLTFTNGVLSGTPTVAGDFDITVTADDGDLESTPVTFSLSVAGDSDPLQIEAEDFSGVSTATSYFVEDVTGASGAQVLRMEKNAEGAVTHDLSGFAGDSYQVAVTFVDETDGVSAGRVLVDGVVVGTWNFDGTEGEQVNGGTPTGGSTQLGNYRTVLLERSFSVTDSSELTVQVDSGGSETGRIDYVTLVPSADPIVIEAEDFSDLGTATSFAAETVANASEGEVIRMDKNASGSVSQDLSAFAGDSYTVAVTFVDETDGVSTGRVLIDGTVIGTWAFNGTAGEQVNQGAVTGGSTQDGNYRTVELTTPFAVGADTELTIEVDTGGSETGRIDNIRLLPADDSVLIEAEDFSEIATATSFFNEVVTDASGGEALRMDKNASGAISHDLGDFAGGTYKVAVTFIDETDGVSTGRVLVDGVQIGTWSFDGTEGTQVNPGTATGGAKQLGNFRTIELDTEFAVTASSELTIEVDTGGSETGRIDNVRLIPTGSFGGPALLQSAVLSFADFGPAQALAGPALADADVVEAEDFTEVGSATSFTVANLAQASGGQVLTMAKNDSGSVTTDLSDFAGDTYKVAVTFIDETDGVSTGRVLVDGVEVGTWSFDGTDGNQVNAGAATGSSVQLGNYRTVVLNTAFAVAADSELTVEVDTGGSEKGRIDKIALVPADLNVIEAEDFSEIDTATSYFVENLADASGGEVIRMEKNASGSITHDISDFAGDTYKVAVTFIDETDGVSSGRVLVDGVEVGTWSFDGTEGTQDNAGAETGPSKQLGNYRTVVLDGVFDVDANSELTIEVDSGGSETGRIDSIKMIQTDPNVIEAEEFSEINTATSYFVENLADASGGEVIRMEKNASGSISHDLSDFAGENYTVAVTFIDETDGVSSGRVLVDGVEIGTWSFDGTDGTQDNPGAPTGGSTQLGNYRTIELSTVFEVNAGSELTIEVDTGGSETGRIDSIRMISQGPINEAPTAVSVDAVIDDIAEDADTSQAIKVGDITITDDGLGTNDLSLSGADANLFEIVGDELFLKAGAALDFDSNPSLDINVVVDDATVGTGPFDATTSFSLDVTEEVIDPPLGDVLLRINAFGPEIVVAGEPNWQEDTSANPISYFNAAQNRGDTDPTPATPGLTDVPDLIFATARSDNNAFSYDIPIGDLPGVSIGDNVTVRLFFAEASDNANLQDPDSRIFDVTMEGELALDDFSPIASFGSGGGGVTETVVKIVDGTLNIDFLDNNTRNAIVSGVEIVKGGTNPINDGATPPVPSGALEILGLDDGDFDGFVQGVAVDNSNEGGNNGKVVLTILDGNESVDASNFKQNALQLQNTGDKEVAAVFIDIRGAVFGDHVFDIDGTGGDTASKSFLIQGDDGTGAYFVGENGVAGNPADNMFFAGETPLPDTSGESDGAAISGGYRGLLIRFDGSDGGFDAGEVVGFSGDGDPNSIAGFKSSDLKPNNVTSGEFDTGGQSGSELIGSSFTVLFADGTTATGYLGSDTTQAGAAGEAVQGRAEKTASLSVDTGSGVFAAGEIGTYGGEVPTITVTGTPGDVVRVVLHKGFRDTNEEAGGSPDLVAEVIQARLDETNPEFAVNNAFDVQTVDVTIKSDGTVEVPTNAFDYINTVSGVSFTDDDIQPLALTASVIVPVSSSGAISGSGASDFVPAGPVTEPIYLTNPTGTPVDGNVVTPPPSEGYFEVVGSGANQYFKMQIEDGTGGTNPGGKWEFFDAPDAAGNQSGFQGDGYYIFGDPALDDIDNNIAITEVLEYTIFVPEEALGTYTFSFRVARDGQFPNDQQNDLWLNFKHTEDEGFGEIENFLIEETDVPEPEREGFIKIFGGPNDGDWGTTGNVDGLPGNFPAVIEITEAGLYTIQLEGRSTGFHVDFFELYKGNNPSNGAADSDFIEVDNGPAQLASSPSGIIAAVADISSSAADFETNGGADSDVLDFGEQDQSVGLRFDTIEIPEGATIREAFIQFEAAETDSAAASYTIAIEDAINADVYSAANGPDDRTYLADEFVWNNVEAWETGELYQTPDLSALIEEMVAANAGADSFSFGFQIEGFGDRAAQAFDGLGAAPELVILFDEPEQLF